MNRPLQRSVLINMSESAHTELATLASDLGINVFEAIRQGIGLMKLVVDAKRQGQRVMVVGKDDVAVMEIAIQKGSAQ